MPRFDVIALAAVLFVGTPSAQETKPGGAAAPGTEKTQSLAVTVPAFPNATCPIMGKPVSGKLFVDTEKGRIYMCCKSCTKKIREDVAKAHQTAYPVTKKVELAACPITGDKLEKDAQTVVIQGYEIPVCCDECVAKVQENAQVILARVTNPKVVDLDNKTCPVTGKPVEKNAFALIGDTLVRLSSPECVAEVRKDAAKILEKATAMKAEAAKPHGHGDGHDHNHGGTGKPSGGHEHGKKQGS